MNNNARPAHNAEVVEGPAAAVEPIDLNAIQVPQISEPKMWNKYKKQTEWCNSPCWGVEREAFEDGNAVDWNLQKLRNHPYFSRLKSNLETRLLIPRSSLEPYEPSSMRRRWDNLQDNKHIGGRRTTPVSKSRVNRRNLQDNAVDQAPARPAAAIEFNLYAFLNHT